MESKKEISSRMIIFSALLVILLGAVVTFLIFSDSVNENVQLIVEEGTVKVNNKIVSTEIYLSEGDTIETFDGLATVILYDSVIVNLDYNTKITLEDLTKEHPRIEQESGTTWNKFTKFLGVQDFSVSSGNTVASVRGTAFQFNTEKISVLEGEVEVRRNDFIERTNSGEVLELVSNGQFNKRNFVKEDIGQIKLFTERSIRSMERIRLKEIEKRVETLKKIGMGERLNDPIIKKNLELIRKGEFDFNTIEREQLKELYGERFDNVHANILDSRRRLMELEKGTIDGKQLFVVENKEPLPPREELPPKESQEFLDLEIEKQIESQIESQQETQEEEVIITSKQ